jgi:hypothetical protein
MLNRRRKSHFSNATVLPLKCGLKDREREVRGTFKYKKTTNEKGRVEGCPEGRHVG